jgi:hypothetical protein
VIRDIFEPKTHRAYSEVLQTVRPTIKIAFVTMETTSSSFLTSDEVEFFSKMIRFADLSLTIV